MALTLLDRAALAAFVRGVDEAFGRPGRLFLVGETTQVYEGLRPWTDHVALAADVAEADRPAFDAALRQVQEAMGVEVLDEHPGDLIPLPDGYEGRAQRAGGGDGAPEDVLHHLQLYHFDPYSVAFRFIARGDEPDYHLVLTYLRHGWITLEGMNAKLERLLPRFSFTTIQQDPAEFRRKYKGLTQMWHAEERQDAQTREQRDAGTRERPDAETRRRGDAETHSET